MRKQFILTEEEKNRIRNFYFFEQKEQSEEKRFCHKGNTKSLEEIVGEDEGEDYVEGVKLRRNGVNGLVDMIELMKTARLHPQISDGCENLAFSVMNTLKAYKPYNYFEETSKGCNRAMDKIIELYKENKHGEELVKDIEKVYQMDHISARAKEFLKHGMGMIKGD